MTTSAALKTVIKAQLSSELDKEFDIGYQEGAVVVSIRNSVDLHELWSAIRMSINIITPHAQRERGKVIGRGVHIVCGRKKI